MVMDSAARVKLALSIEKPGRNGNWNYGTAR